MTDNTSHINILLSNSNVLVKTDFFAESTKIKNIIFSWNLLTTMQQTQQFDYKYHLLTKLNLLKYQKKFAVAENSVRINIKYIYTSTCSFHA